MSTSLRQQLASYWQRIQLLEIENERLTGELEEVRRTIAVLASQVAASGSNPPATGKPKTRLDAEGPPVYGPISPCQFWRR